MAYIATADRKSHVQILIIGCGCLKGNKLRLVVVRYKLEEGEVDRGRVGSCVEVHNSVDVV